MSIDLQILLYLHEHAGSRQRYIASACHVWLCDAIFMGAIRDLHDLGLIRNESINDPAQMEFYYKWYLTEKGEKIVKDYLTAQG